MNLDLVSGALGAEVNNFDLNSLNNKNFEEVNNLLLEHKVIFFRNQSLTLEKFILQISPYSIFIFLLVSFNALISSKGIAISNVQYLSTSLESLRVPLI